MVNELNLMDRIRSGLTHLLDQCQPLIQKYGSLPTEGSKAASELLSSMRPESIRTAFSIGQLLIEFSAEHISAFVKLTAAPVEISATFTCVRSMLESSSLAAWMLDPAIDSTERISRVFAYRFESLEQQLRYGKNTNRPAQEVNFLKNRIDDAEKEALQLGYQAVRDKNGKRIGICQKMPTATDMIDRMLNEGNNYRLLSAVAHGHHWAITGLGYKRASQEDPVTADGMTLLTKTDDGRGVALFGSVAFHSLCRPLWCLADYFGFDKLEFEEAIENAADTMTISPDRRFWRSAN